MSDSVSRSEVDDGEQGVEIALQNPNGYREVKVRRLRPWFEQLVGEITTGRSSLSVRFVGDRAMRRLNRDYRGRDATTDVLSFPAVDSPEGDYLGDIAVSVPAARRQSAAVGHSVGNEIRILLLHGLLHCLGHDHESDGGEMSRLEQRLRRRWIGRDD